MIPEWFSDREIARLKAERDAARADADRLAEALRFHRQPHPDDWDYCTVCLLAHKASQVCMFVLDAHDVEVAKR